MHKPDRCGKCGAEPEERKRCPRCGEAEWVLHYGAHYMRGACEVIGCSCPSSHSALGRRKIAINQRQAKRVNASKRADWNRPVTTPEMARKAAEGLARGLSARRALQEAGFPPATVNRSGAGINRMIRTELKTLGRKYIQMGRDLSPEDQEAIVRGRLVENVIVGSDRGVMAGKQLGSDKRVAMWQAVSVSNLVVLQAPPIRQVNHPVPLLPSKHPEDLE